MITVQSRQRWAIFCALLLSIATVSVTASFHFLDLSDDQPELDPEPKVHLENLGMPYHNRVQNTRKILFASHVVDTEYEPNAKGEIERLSLAKAKRAVNKLFGWEDDIVDDGIERTWMVQLRDPLTQDLKERVSSALGMPLSSYLPHNTYLFVSGPSVARRLLDDQGRNAIDGVMWVGVYPAEAKLTGDLAVLHKMRKGDRAASELVQAWAKDKIILIVELNPKERTLQQSQQVASGWNGLVLNSSLPFFATATHPNRLLVSSEDVWQPSDLERLCDLLAQQPESHSIERSLKQKLGNMYAQWLTQGGISTPGSRVVWDKGLRGENQIIGCADSGLDYGHCLFADYSNGNQPGPTHRKVLRYQVFADGQDYPNGHGTHVVGSIAGSFPTSGVTVPNALRGYEGMAPNAKIFFQDVGDNTGLPGLDGIDLGSELFQPTFDAGARLHSNSWGANVNAYTSMSRSLDRFVWDNPEFTILFAAGNDGLKEGSVSGTVGSPATAKNCITVGASQTTNDGWTSSLDAIDWPARQAEAREALNMPSLDCCTSSAITDKVREYCCKSYMERQIGDNPDLYNARNMADFSSRGPTNDGRIKPTVVAPGQFIVSAKSDGTLNLKCRADGLLAMAGTSMATPVMAGNAALVRQYYMEGFYGGKGVQTLSQVLRPTAALVAATLINAGTALGGQIDVNNDGSQYAKLDTIYPESIFQGWGKVELARTLWFAGEQSFQLYVDQSPSISTRQDRDYCFTPTAAGSVKATIVWMDFPGETSASVAAVNNLDLIAGHDQQDALAGNFVDNRDERNNVEHIIFNNVPAGRQFFVKVRGYNVPQGPQPFAIVITGQFDRDQVSTTCPAFNIDFDHFSAADDSDYFPYGAVIGGSIGGGVALIGLVLILIRYCLYGKAK